MELQAHEFNFDGLNVPVYQQTEDGEHTVCFDPHRVIHSPYEIKDGKRIEQTVQGVDIIVTIYKTGYRYIGARGARAGYCNFEIFYE